MDGSYAGIFGIATKSTEYIDGNRIRADASGIGAELERISTGRREHVSEETNRTDKTWISLAPVERQPIFLCTGAKPGDPFDHEVGGFLLGPDSGTPVRIRGTVVHAGPKAGLPRYQQPSPPSSFGAATCWCCGELVIDRSSSGSPVDSRRYSAWMLESRAHFRRGFDDNGYAGKILIVDAPVRTWTRCISLHCRKSRSTWESSSPSTRAGWTPRSPFRARGQ
jgi:hypothetical protein